MTDFEKELLSLLNRHSKENESDTPDFIIAEYLIGCLNVFNESVNNRKLWYSETNKQIEKTSTMTYYLHNNKLYNIDRMPPERKFLEGVHTFSERVETFHAHLSTLTPIPHELKGEGIVILDRDFKWDLRGVGDPLYGSTGQPSYKAWQRVAVPIEAKEQEVTAPQQTDEEYRGVEYWKQLAINDGRKAIQHLEQILQLQKKIEQLSSQTPQQHPAKETMLEQLADLLKKYDVRKYLNLNDSGYSQVERDIVDLFTSHQPQQQHHLTDTEGRKGGGC